MTDGVPGSGKVSVLIPCYERTADLAATLTQLRRQDYPDLEIIVLDDCSPTADVAATVARFPEARYHRTPSNRGLIAARNYGNGLCTGEYLLNLDDDSWPVADDSISQAVALMSANPRLGVLAFTIDERGFPAKPSASPDSVAPATSYIGCGNLYRMSALRAAGPYMEVYRRQGEETEHCLRLIDAGFAVARACGLRVWHDLSSLGRDDVKINSYNLINLVRTELLRAPAVMLPLSLVRVGVYAWRNSHQIDRRLVYNELRTSSGDVRTMLRQRKPVSLSTYVQTRVFSRG